MTNEEMTLREEVNKLLRSQQFICETLVKLAELQDERLKEILAELKKMNQEVRNRQAYKGGS